MRTHGRQRGRVERRAVAKPSALQPNPSTHTCTLPSRVERFVSPTGGAHTHDKLIAKQHSRVVPPSPRPKRTVRPRPSVRPTANITRARTQKICTTGARRCEIFHGRTRATIAQYYVCVCVCVGFAGDMEIESKTDMTHTNTRARTRTNATGARDAHKSPILFAINRSRHVARCELAHKTVRLGTAGALSSRV